MGILNLTPDSFSDGGVHDDLESGLAAAAVMERDGATILDLGAESTRPGAAPVSAVDECERLLPLLEALRPRTDLLISIDTSKAEVAEQALERGADLINDVTGLHGDPDLASVVARYEAPVVLMHMRGEPRTMQDAPRYENALREVRDELTEAVGRAHAAGIPDSQIVLDPGIGFAKRDEDHRALLQGLPKLVSTGYPILLGVSRKSLLGRALVDDRGRIPPPRERDAATIALVCHAWRHGVSIHRVHQVRYAVDALRASEAFCRRE